MFISRTWQPTNVAQYHRQPKDLPVCRKFSRLSWKELKALRNVHLFSFKFHFLFYVALLVSRMLHEVQLCCVPRAGFPVLIHPLVFCDCQVSPFQEGWGQRTAGVACPLPWLRKASVGAAQGEWGCVENQSVLEFLVSHPGMALLGIARDGWQHNPGTLSQPGFYQLLI